MLCINSITISETTTSFPTMFHVVNVNYLSFDSKGLKASCKLTKSSISAGFFPTYSLFIR